MSLLLALAVSPLVQAASMQDASVAERAAAAAVQVCEPFLAGRLAKEDAAEAAAATGLKRLSRAGGDFVFLMAGDLALALSGEGDMRDCSVSVEKLRLDQVTTSLQAAAASAKWPEMPRLAKSHLWLTPSHMMAAIDESYDEPAPIVAIRFRKRGFGSPVAGKPADPLGLAAGQICIPYAERRIGFDDARDLAIAQGLMPKGKAFADDDVELSLAETIGIRRCTLTVSAPGEALSRRAAALQGPGHSVRVSGRALVVTSLPAK